MPRYKRPKKGDRVRFTVPAFHATRAGQVVEGVVRVARTRDGSIRVEEMIGFKKVAGGFEETITTWTVSPSSITVEIVWTPGRS